jgi:hypothetical protein
VVLAAAVAVALAGTAAPVSAASLEYRVKAACLCNFFKFIVWPPRAFAGPDTPYALCVLGSDPFGSDLDATAAGASVGRRLVVRRIDAAKAATGCHIVYVSDSERKSLPAILQALGGNPVLTVADDPDFTRLGGGLRFFIADAKVRFEINLPSVERGGLVPSAKLLSLAQVIGKPGAH